MTSKEFSSYLKPWWCTICGDDIVDKSITCQHTALRNVSLKQKGKLDQQINDQKIDQEDLMFHYSTECGMTLPKEICNQLQKSNTEVEKRYQYSNLEKAQAKEIAELKKQVQYWNGAWHDQRIITGKIQ